MATIQERKKRGEEIVKRYRSISGPDIYAGAVDALADILLYVAQSEDEVAQLLQSAEMDYKDALEGESIASEG